MNLRKFLEKCGEHWSWVMRYMRMVLTELEFKVWKFFNLFYKKFAVCCKYLLSIIKRPLTSQPTSAYIHLPHAYANSISSHHHQCLCEITQLLTQRLFTTRSKYKLKMADTGQTTRRLEPCAKGEIGHVTRLLIGRPIKANDSKMLKLRIKRINS